MCRCQRCKMTSSLQCCPSWLAYTGAICMWLILVGAGIGSIYEGKKIEDAGKEFKDLATEEQCFLINHVTHQCSCGDGCNSWSNEYFAKTDMCPNTTLTTGQYRSEQCGYHQLPLKTNATYTCYVLSCNDEFSFERHQPKRKQANTLITGGIALSVGFGLVPLLVLAVYYGYKLCKRISKRSNMYQKIRRWTGNDD
eukprot:394714_1